MTEILVAVLAFIGTLCGTFGGILTSAKLTNYRIKQLEIKVDKHNGFAERMPLVEKDVSILKDDIREIKKKKYEGDYHEQNQLQIMAQSRRNPRD